MQKVSIIALAASSVISMSGLASAATPTVSVSAALAPNSFGSPSYVPYISNAEYAMQNGLSSYGSGPAQFSAVTSTITRSAAIVTGFNSWLGNANPVPAYGAAYSAELGNRMSFPLDVKGNGTKISISQLSFTATSTGDLNGLGFSFATGAYNYGGNTGSDYIGIDYGVDGIKGTPDDVIVNSGANTQLVDEIVGRGSGNSYAAYADTLGVLTNQQELDAAANDPLAQWNTFTGLYSFDLGGGNTVAASAAFSAVPEPTTFGLIAVAAAGLLRRRRRTA